jgi:hypothetical protein
MTSFRPSAIPELQSPESLATAGYARFIEEVGTETV